MPSSKNARHTYINMCSIIFYKLAAITKPQKLYIQEVLQVRTPDPR